ncbi:hypothetical protein [Moorena sp. SIO1G6]|nr:hypothetical protein [Moorena sp. SIO1G6]
MWNPVSLNQKIRLAVGHATRLTLGHATRSLTNTQYPQLFPLE